MTLFQTKSKVSDPGSSRKIIGDSMKCMAALHAFVKLPPQQLLQQSVSPSLDPFAVLIYFHTILALPIDLMNFHMSCSAVPLLQPECLPGRFYSGPYLARALVGMLAFTRFTSISAFAPKVSFSTKEPSTSLATFSDQKTGNCTCAAAPALVLGTGQPPWCT